MAKLIFEKAEDFVARKDSVSLVKGLFYETHSGIYQDEDIYTALKMQIDIESFFIVAEDEENGQIKGASSFYLTLNSFFNKTIAVEQFIYVFPEYRKSSLYFRLLKETIRVVKTSPAKAFYIGSSNIHELERLRYYQMLQRCGFTEDHRSFTLNL